MTADADIAALTDGLPQRVGDYAESWVKDSFLGVFFPSFGKSLNQRATSVAASLQSDKTSWLSQLLSMFSGFMSSIKSSVLSWADNDSLIARNNMLARIGLAADGETPAGANPLLAIDTKIGVSAAPQIQAILSRQIYASTGLFGMANHGTRDVATIQGVLAMRDDISKTYLQALKVKYGTANIPALEAIAQQATNVVLGADSSQTATLLVASPATNGFVALVSNTQMNAGHAIANLSFGNDAMNALNKALNDFVRPPAQAQAQAQAQIQGANILSLPSADITGQFSLTPLPVRFGDITADNLSGGNITWGI